MRRARSDVARAFHAAEHCVDRILFSLQCCFGCLDTLLSLSGRRLYIFSKQRRHNEFANLLLETFLAVFFIVIESGRFEQ